MVTEEIVTAEVPLFFITTVFALLLFRTTEPKLSDVGVNFSI